MAPLLELPWDNRDLDLFDLRDTSPAEFLILLRTFRPCSTPSDSLLNRIPQRRRHDIV